MKLFWKTAISVFVLIQGCQNPGHLEKDASQFVSSNDTLVIRTEKQKDRGLFMLGWGPLTFQDSAQEFPYPVIYPETMRDIERTQMTADFAAKESKYIDIIKGRIGEELVFVVDENNNNDLSDDSIRVPNEFKLLHNNDLVKCKYLISNGQEIVEDSSWLSIVTLDGRWLCGRFEHLTADFGLDGTQYQIGIIDPVAAMTFTYGFAPEIALLSENSNNRDTLFTRDLLKRGEFVNLDDTYYRFDSITNNGEYVILVRELDFDTKIGTQVGMIAPDFHCISVIGDTIRSSNLHDRPIVISNSCGCGGDKLSTEAFYELGNTFADEIYSLRLDSKIERGLEGLQIDMEEEYNKDIYDKYRKDYCSRISYVIGKNRRILDKFMITDWKSHLSKSFYD